MELYDEDFLDEKKDNSKKTATIILVVIVLLLILVAGLAGGIYYIKSTSLLVQIDGVVSSKAKDLMIIDEQNPSEVYIPIKEIAEYLGYKGYSGNYTTKSEDTKQCYVQNDNEIAMFTLNSNVLYKKLNSSDAEYEYFYIDNPVKAVNGQLCTTIDGIEKAFNVSFEYDVSKNKMVIYTLPYLVSYYTANIEQMGYTSISDDYVNQKAILEDMLVVDIQENGSSVKEGVIDLSTMEKILEVKYDSVEYLQRSSDFMVTDDGKVGIISKAKKTKVQIQYDSIELMDNDTGLYKVSKSGKYGVIDTANGKIILELDFDAIGIDKSKFQENDVKNGNVIANTLIPVKQNDLWGFYDVSGNQITECKYESVGYIPANNKSGYSLLLVPDYNVVVVGTKDKYTIMTLTGKEIWSSYPFDSVYMSILNGETSYKMVYNSEVLDVCQYLDNLGYGKNGD